MALNLDFLSMGNYGIFVWFAYSTATIILFSLLYISIRKWQKISAEGKILEAELTHKNGKAK